MLDVYHRAQVLADQYDGEIPIHILVPANATEAEAVIACLRVLRRAGLVSPGRPGYLKLG